MELECWSEDWGIPSIEPECLKILAFAKFSGAPVIQKSTNNPFWTPRGDLPVFRHNGNVLSDFVSVSRHLKACNYSADYNLSAKQVAEANAFIQMMDEKLHPALKYLMWVDTKNQIELTRPWYGKHLPFPLGLYYPNKFEHESVKLIESLYGQFSDNYEIGNDSTVETTVYKHAEECLTSLSNRLGESPFMFGRSPSGLDAVMYGYLAPLLKAPYPSNSLQNYLKGCTNLSKFVVRVSQNYFPKIVKAYEEKVHDNAKSGEAKASSDTKNSSTDPEEESWPNERKNKIIASCVATTAMLGYAYGSGLVDIVRNIELRVVDDDEDYDDEYEDEES